MAVATWSVLGTAGGLGVWALLLTWTTRLDGIDPTRQQLRAARRASTDQRRSRVSPAAQS